MKAILIAATLVLMAGPALAQKQMPRYGEIDDKKTPSEIEAERKADADYKRSTSNVPTAAPVDPWGSVRSDAKAGTKAAPAKSKKPTAQAN